MAALLFEPSELAESARLARLLEFFGVRSTRLEPGRIPAKPDVGAASKVRLLGSARAFLKLLAATEQYTDGAQVWRENVHSVFVYARGDAGSLQELARRLTGDDRTSVVQAPDGASWLVSDAHRDFCGSMSGVRVCTRESAAEAALALGPSFPESARIVSCEAGAAALKLEYGGVPVILATTRSVTDLDAPLTHSTFDIRRDFLSAAPVVMYVKWAFAADGWRAPATGACVVIDDPLLTPSYGFLDFRHLLDLMGVHGFSTNIAFIPWNWRRSSAKVVRLFKENADRLSLSVHGCDHTGGEFGSQDKPRTAWRARQAILRMARHEAMTGIPFDPVMVFPQGVFSENAMAVLKRSSFIGAVNSDVISSDLHPQQVKVADYWDVAVMNYCSFPIFTRRYPSDGVENFAFDILLGKPCLIVIHHGDCRDRCRALVELVDRINGLNAPIVWGGLGQVVRQSFRQRETSPDFVDVEMFGSEVRVRNQSRARKRFRICKRESDPDTVRGVRAGSGTVDWQLNEGRIAFEIGLNAGESETARILYADFPDDGLRGETLRYRAKAMLRRYLSEVRDNYLSRGPFSA